MQSEASWRGEGLSPPGPGCCWWGGQGRRSRISQQLFTRSFTGWWVEKQTATRVWVTENWGHFEKASPNGRPERIMGPKIRPRRRNPPRRGMDLGRAKTLEKGKSSPLLRADAGRRGRGLSGAKRVPSSERPHSRSRAHSWRSLGLSSSKRLLNKIRSAQ